MVAFDKYTFNPGENIIMVGRQNTGKTYFVTQKIIKDLINNMNLICVFTQLTNPKYLNKYTSINLNETKLMMTYKPITFNKQYKQIKKEYSESKTQTLIIIDSPEFDFKISKTFQDILLNGQNYGITLVVVIENSNNIQDGFPIEFSEGFSKYFSKLITTTETSNFMNEDIYTIIVENMIRPNINKNLDYYSFTNINRNLKKNEYFMLTNNSIQYKLTIPNEIDELCQKIKELKIS